MTGSVRQALLGLCLVALGLFVGASFAKGTDFRGSFPEEIKNKINNKKSHVTIKNVIYLVCVNVLTLNVLFIFWFFLIFFSF